MTGTPSEPGAARGLGRGLVITSSNRAAAGVYADRAGPVLVQGLRDMGFTVAEPVVAPDGEPFRQALVAALAEAYDVVLTTGGTGLTPGDVTPEVTAPLLTRPVPGLAEAIRARGAAKGVATAALSRGLAGLAGTTLVVNLPGSPGGCADAIDVLSQVLPHAVSQVRGGDHHQPPPGAG